MSEPADTLHRSELRSLELLRRGKVRDIYAVDDDRLLIVATDRLSAFDVVLPDPIPGKGRALTALSSFWFSRLGHVIPNHLLDMAPESVVGDAGEAAQVCGRSVVVRRLQPLPVEAVVRGYLMGSGWKDYQREGRVSGLRLPPNLRQAQRLPEPIFTPSTKAAPGTHDRPIDFSEVARLVGRALADRMREAALQIYAEAVRHATRCGLIVADTKMEFGLDRSGELFVMDELLTPDSSRFWPADEYRVGTSPPSFDKQFVRDYLESVGWDKRPPAPRLPAEVIAATARKYREVSERLIG